MSIQTRLDRLERIMAPKESSVITIVVRYGNKEITQLKCNGMVFVRDVGETEDAFIARAQTEALATASPTCVVLTMVSS